MRPICQFLGHILVVLTSSKSIDITNIFVKSILVDVHYTILLCPLTILDLRPL